MPYRTYRLGGDYISVDMDATGAPAHWDEYWEITAEAYAALNAAAVPGLKDDGDIVIDGDEFPPPPDPDPPPEGPEA